MSKIRSAATAAGVSVAFARSADAALDQLKQSRPSLVIFDLNNPRTNPFTVIGAMKADAELAAIPTIGFASHVQVDVIEAAKRAGVGEVLPRSAFAQRLPDLLRDPS